MAVYRTADRLPAAAAADRPRRRWRRRVAAALAVIIVVALVLASWTALRLRSRLLASLPALEGSAEVAGLGAEVAVERDGLGIPTIRAATRLDAARALGFVHAQDRFFAMDLVRRRAAGELAALLGEPGLAEDRRQRVHRFRDLAQRTESGLPPAERALLAAYAEGVEAGRAALGAPPFEYWLLRTEPEPWRPEDSLLVLFSVYLELQGATIIHESMLGVLHEELEPEVFELLAAPGTAWDAPLAGHEAEPAELAAVARAAAPAPPPRAALAAPHPPPALAPAGDGLTTAVPGSNAWAVSGERTADGRALLANDVHLSLALPSFWYRAAWSWREEGGGPERFVSGLTLPGLPLLVTGSNGSVAWGITSSLADTSDLIVIEPDPAGAGRYLAPGGPREYERHEERIEVRGGRPETLEVLWTEWGPRVGEDERGRPRALAWVAHQPGAVDLSAIGLETAATVGEAVDVARRAGGPAQNVLAADAGGRIAWTILGRLPRRVGFDGRLPGSWSDGARSWDGLVPPEEVPAVIDPGSGLLWSANNRPLDFEMLGPLGDGGYRFGARARQIRDRLEALEAPGEAEMLELQLDVEARSLVGWHRLLREVLAADPPDADPRRREIAAAVAAWDGRAVPGSAGFRLIRAYRLMVASEVFDPLTAPCREVDERFDYRLYPHAEEPLWSLVQSRPERYLPGGYDSWDDLLSSAVDRVVDLAAESGASPGSWTWGGLNRLTLAHPLSRGVPLLGRWLDLPAVELPGADDVPRVQIAAFGAASRVVVSPGLEAEGYAHMPGGQSGHPLSLHYGDAQEAWVEGRPTPFLPGPARHLLKLVPPASGPSDETKGDRP